jgi:hypothetical protein
MFLLGGALGPSSLFVAPLGDGFQLTAVSTLLLPAPDAQRALVVLPAPGPARVCAWPADSVQAFVRAAALCFPSTAPAPPPEADDDDDDGMGGAQGVRGSGAGGGEMEEEEEAPAAAGVVPDAAGGGYAGGVAVAPLTGPPSCVVDAASLATYLPPAAAAELVAAYPAPGWVFVLVDVALPPAGACAPGTPLPVAVAVVHAQPTPSTLFVPLRTGLPSGACPPADVYSVGTARVCDWSGGGKTPAEAVDDIHRRHASGTFRVLVPAVEEYHRVCGGPTAPRELVAAYAGVAGSTTTLGGAPAVTLPGAAGAPPLPWIACVRHKRVVVPPEHDIALQLDDGRVPIE